MLAAGGGVHSVPVLRRGRVVLAVDEEVRGPVWVCSAGGVRRVPVGRRVEWCCPQAAPYAVAGSRAKKGRCSKGAR